MKIAILGGPFLLDESTGISGAQVQNYNLASAFAGRGLDVHYIAFTKDKKAGSRIENKIKVHSVQQKKLFFRWLWDMWVYMRVLNYVNPDIIYQRGRSYLTYVAAKCARKNGKKFIWGSNGEDSCDFWRQIKRLRQSQRPFWKKIILFPYMVLQDIFIHKGIRRAHGHVNQTKHQKSRLQKNYEKQGVIIPSYFTAPSNERRYAKEKSVLWLANLGQNKRPELFLRLAEYCIDNNDWKFILGGGTKDTEYFQKLYQQAQTLSNVEILGHVPFNKTNDLFARASLFVNTSTREADGLPNSFIQAWLNNTPVLSLYHDPNNWISSRNLGVCANGDRERFFEMGKTLISDKEKLKRNGENCVSFAIETFCDERIIDSYIDLFKSL